MIPTMLARTAFGASVHTPPVPVSDLTYQGDFLPYLNGTIGPADATATITAAGKTVYFVDVPDGIYTIGALTDTPGTHGTIDVQRTNFVALRASAPGRVVVDRTLNGCAVRVLHTTSTALARLGLFGIVLKGNPIAWESSSGYSHCYGDYATTTLDYLDFLAKMAEVFDWWGTNGTPDYSQNHNPSVAVKDEVPFHRKFYRPDGSVHPASALYNYCYAFQNNTYALVSGETGYPGYSRLLISDPNYIPSCEDDATTYGSINPSGVDSFVNVRGWLDPDLRERATGQWVSAKWRDLLSVANGSWLPTGYRIQCSTGAGFDHRFYFTDMAGCDDGSYWGSARRVRMDGCRSITLQEWHYNSPTGDWVSVDPGTVTGSEDDQFHNDGFQPATGCKDFVLNHFTVHGRTLWNKPPPSGDDADFSGDHWTLIPDHHHQEGGVTQLTRLSQQYTQFPNGTYRDVYTRNHGVGVRKEHTLGDPYDWQSGILLGIHTAETFDYLMNLNVTNVEMFGISTTTAANVLSFSVPANYSTSSINGVTIGASPGTAAEAAVPISQGGYTNAQFATVASRMAITTDKASLRRAAIPYADVFTNQPLLDEVFAV